MNVLIGTDVLLYYLQKQELDGIVMLFSWIDKIKSKKFIDLSSIAILTNFVSLDSFEELSSFDILKGVKPKNRKIEEIKQADFLLKGFNYRPLLAQLNWLCYDDVDFLITENTMSHKIARILDIDDKVFSIEGFIEKCSIEHLELDETLGVSIEKILFGELDYNDRFFNSFKAEYEPYYHTWFKNKANDEVYVAKDLNNNIRGLLKLKIEEQAIEAGDIIPAFKPAKRLKISSLKADYTSQKLGQRFMRIVFDTALRESVDEIYVTLFSNSPLRRRLVGMISQWGFIYYGTKDGNEQVFVRSFRKEVSNDLTACFPFCSFHKNKLIVPINRFYAAQLLPVSSVEKTTELEPAKHAIKKVLILHQDAGTLESGSLLFFIQKSADEKSYELISLGVVENVYRNFEKESSFVRRCRKRSTFSNNALHDFWLGSLEKPIVVEFLYICHFEENILKSTFTEIGVDLKMLKSQCPIIIDDKQAVSFIKNTPYEKVVVANTSQIC